MTPAPNTPIISIPADGIIAGKTLHELAEMPFGKAAKMIRHYVDPDWGCSVEGDAVAQKWDVCVDYKFLEDARECFTITAESEEEAKAIAKREFECRIYHAHDIDCIDAEPSTGGELTPLRHLKPKPTKGDLL